MNRRALIVLVPDHQEPRLSIPEVRADASDLTDSLRSSGYEVSTIGDGDRADVSPNNIRKAIREACLGAPQDGTLLIFLSGHGVHHEGRDYFVPFDGDPAAPDQLVEIDFARYVDKSQARRVVVFVDACREGTRTGLKGVAMFGTQDRTKAQRVQMGIVFGCEPNQHCHYVPEKFSLFSRALAGVISTDHHATTLREVITHTNKKVTELAAENGIASDQIISFKSESTLDANILDECICDARSDTGLLADATWADIANASPLWTRAIDHNQPDLKTLRTTTSNVASIAESAFTATEHTEPDDPWLDRAYPKRVIEALHSLTASGGAIPLTAPEVAVLLAAPFVREHAYAAACAARHMSDHLRVSPGTDGLDGGMATLRQRLEITHQSNPHIIRRAQALRAKNSPEQKKSPSSNGDAVMNWLLHKHLAKAPDVWTPTPDGTLPPHVGDPDLDEACASSPAVQRTMQRLVRFAQFVRCAPSRLDTRSAGPAFDTVTIPFGEGESQIREDLVACLLCLAGWMALDIRCASDVLVDHIGLADPLDPHDAVVAFSEARWSTSGTGQTLHAKCSHPAIDFAMRELVEKADAVLTRVRSILAERVDASALLTALPTRLIADHIEPQREEGIAAYRTPHMRFELDHDKVRELLMGEQLYGKPDLAVRELYQNALDACRFMRARTEFLGNTGHAASWVGEIKFRQGVDNGRHYIECSDNGVGMDERVLETCFSRAGHRFADLPEFIEERDRWQRRHPPIEIHPNSQFGIGVLSYFMIADELEVTTCAFDTNGRLGRRLRVSIPGSSGLFRIRDEGEGAVPGTTVRLYLQEGWDKPCRSILEQLLILAEFDTTAEDKKGTTTWEAGRLADTSAGGDACIPTTDPNFFWSPRGPGEILADGIRVEGRSHKEHTFGRIVNLTGVRRPTLSVDRKSLLSWDESWVRESSIELAGRVDNHVGMSFSFLWDLPDDIAQSLTHRLTNLDAYIPLTITDYSGDPFYKHRYPSISEFLEKATTTQVQDGLNNHLDPRYPIATIGLAEFDIDLVFNASSLTSYRESADTIRGALHPKLSVEFSNIERLRNRLDDPDANSHGSPTAEDFAFAKFLKQNPHLEMVFKLEPVARERQLNALTENIAHRAREEPTHSALRLAMWAHYGLPVDARYRDFLPEYHPESDANAVMPAPPAQRRPWHQPVTKKVQDIVTYDEFWPLTAVCVVGALALIGLVMVVIWLIRWIF